MDSANLTSVNAGPPCNTRMTSASTKVAAVAAFTNGASAKPPQEEGPREPSEITRLSTWPESNCGEFEFATF
jgi:hypothetical protein